MPRLLVLLLAGLFAAVAVTDAVACPDGCADGAAQHGPVPEQPSACVACHGWSGPASAPAWKPVFSPVAILVACRAFTHDPHLPAVYHPPRSAHPRSSPRLVTFAPAHAGWSLQAPSRRITNRSEPRV